MHLRYSSAPLVSIITTTSKYPATQLCLMYCKTTVAQVILLSYHSLPLVKVTSVSLSCSLFSEHLSFSYPHLSFLQLFLLELWSPLSFVCETFTFFFVLLLSFSKLMPSLLVNSTHFLVTINHLLPSLSYFRLSL